MSCPKQAVLIFEEDAAVPAGLKPLMLETVLSRPILSWVCDRLRAEGVQRLFAVCGPRFAEEARGILPPDPSVAGLAQGVGQRRTGELLLRIADSGVCG